MDSFQGSSPRKFISFCLENPTDESYQPPDPAFIQVPNKTSSVDPELQKQPSQQISSKEYGSDEDVNAYADNIVRLKEGSTISGTGRRVDSEEQPRRVTAPVTDGLDEVSRIRTSTPVPISQVRE